MRDAGAPLLLRRAAPATPGATPSGGRVQGDLVAPVPARLAVAAVALAAAAPVILALRTVRELDRPQRALAPGARRAAKRPSARLETDRRGRRERLRLEGTRLRRDAPSSCSRAAASSRSSPVANGRFRFDGIREQGPYRVGAMPLSADGSRTRRRRRPPPPAAPRPSPRPPLARRRDRGRRRRVPAAAARSRPDRAARSGRRARTGARSAAASPRAPDLTRGPVRPARGPGLLRRRLLGPRRRRRSSTRCPRRGIRTTIFLTGEFIRRYPDIARRIAADGHEVGNHTDTHPHLTTYAADGRQVTRLGVDRAFVAGELARTARLYREATGRTMAPLWRAPFGEHNAEIRRWAAEQGYWHVGWTGGRSRARRPRLGHGPGARAPTSRPTRLLARLVQHAENGGIVLLHLGSDREEPVGVEDRRCSSTA